jgi:hypothetical protein
MREQDLAEQRAIEESMCIVSSSMEEACQKVIGMNVTPMMKDSAQKILDEYTKYEAWRLMPDIQHYEVRR